MTKAKTIAEVNGEPICEWQLTDAMISYSRELIKKDLKDLTSLEYNECRHEALEKLIGSELLYLEATSCGYDISEDVLEEAITSFKSSLSPDYTFYDYLEERGISESDFRKKMRKQIIKEEFVTALLSKIPMPTEKDAASYYQKVKDKLCHPPRFIFFVCYIPNPTDEERDRFKSAFINLANRSFESAFAETIMKDTNQILERAVFATYEKKAEELPQDFKNLLLNTNEKFFTPIFDAPDEISIIFLDKKEYNKPLSEAEGKKEAQRYLSVIRVKKILDAYIDSLKDKYTIKIYI